MTKQFMMGNAAFGHAALEAGVGVVAGYPGTPSSEIIETIASVRAQGGAADVHVEWSTNEKAALEVLAGASYAGARGLYTCKQVGLNVASDALMSLNYVGVNGGVVLVVADDPGPISSQTEQDTRRFASFAKVPVFDPATPEQGCAMIAAAYELSERYHTPVIFRPTTRVCHASTFFDIAEATQAKSAEGFVKDEKWVIFPKRAYEAHGEINDRLPCIANDFSQSDFNPITCVLPDGTRILCSNDKVATSSQAPNLTSATAAQAAMKNQEKTPIALGIVAGGISYAYAQEALRTIEQRAARAGVAVPAYKIMQVGTPYPFPETRALKFAHGLSRVIVFEELDHVLEDEMVRLAGRYHLPYEVEGKLTGATNNRGENSTDILIEQLLAFFGLPTTLASANVDDVANVPDKTDTVAEEIVALAPARPALLCAGCPHRGAFYAVKKAVKQTKHARFCGDIGCYTLGNAAPLNAVDTCLCMGAGITIAQGFSIVEPNVKSVAFVGDSTFFASGMTGVANAVYNQHDITIAVLDNSTTAMTGSQPHPGTGQTLMGTSTPPISIKAVLQALGVQCIVSANPLHYHESLEAAKTAIEFNGPSAILFEAPCTALIKPKPCVQLDSEVCTSCMRCVTQIGCPALSWSAEDNQPEVDESLCYGCGLCSDICPDGALVCAACENNNETVRG